MPCCTNLQAPRAEDHGQRIRGHVEGIIYLTQVPHEKLHSALQLCEALLGCPFVLLSNGHAYIVAPAGQS